MTGSWKVGLSESLRNERRVTGGLKGWLIDSVAVEQDGRQRVVVVAVV